MIWFDLKIFLCKLLIWDWCHSDDCHGVSLHDVLFQFCQWKMTLSRVSYFLNIERYFIGVLSFFFQQRLWFWNNSVWNILLDHQADFLMNRRVVGEMVTFFKLGIRDLLLKWFMIECDRDCFLSGNIIFWEKFL